MKQINLHSTSHFRLGVCLNDRFSIRGRQIGFDGNQFAVKQRNPMVSHVFEKKMPTTASFDGRKCGHQCAAFK